MNSVFEDRHCRGEAASSRFCETENESPFAVKRQDAASPQNTEITNLTARSVSICRPVNVFFTEEPSNVTKISGADGGASKDDSLTVCEVRTETVIGVPVFQQRKCLGVGEFTTVSVDPDSGNISMWSNDDRFDSGSRRYEASHREGAGTVTISDGSVSFPLNFIFIEPLEIRATAITGYVINSNTPAGDFYADISLTTFPTNVSL